MDMHIEDSSLLGLFCLSVIFCVAGYVFLRNIIWSIVWCDKGGKYNSLKKLIRNRSVWDKINMKYLENQVGEYKKDFKFWFLVKEIYVILEVLLIGIYLILYFIEKTDFSQMLMKIIAIQSAIVYFIISFQTDINRHTKYDRIRMQKRDKKKRK